MYSTVNLLEIHHLAEELILEHLPDPLFPGVTQWQFSWHDKIDALGTCSYKDKTIYLSKRWTRELPYAEILDTILHEIAHAIAGSKAGHGPVWKKAAVKLGARPETTAKNLGIGKDDIATATHHMVDSTTGKIVKRYYRKPNARVYSRIHTYYALGRKQATIGKLVIREVPLIDKL